MSNQGSADFSVHNLIGSFGLYQTHIFIMIFLTQIPTTIHQFSSLITSPYQEHICLDEGENIIGKCPCSNVTFDQSTFSMTTTHQWTLVCERAWIAHFSEAAMILGMSLGCFAFGILSDMYGRRSLFQWGVYLQITSAGLAGINIYSGLHVFLRFITGLGTGGIIVTGYVLMMEFIGIEKRTLIGCIAHLGINYGQMTLALIGYLSTNWKHIQFLIAIISVVQIVFYCLMPESVKWLLAVGLLEKANNTIKKITRRNNQLFTTIEREVTRKPSSILHFIKSSNNIRQTSYAISFIWLVCGFSYFTILEYGEKFHENILINIAISGVITAPGVLISISALSVMGRKKSLMLLLCMSSTVLLYYCIMPEDRAWKISMIVMGRTLTYTSIIIAYLITVEIYPTVVRATALGTCLLAFGTGSITVHYIALVDMSKEWLMVCVCGLLHAIGSLVCVYLPETENSPLLETLDDSENTYESNL